VPRRFGLRQGEMLEHVKPSPSPLQCARPAPAGWPQPFGEGDAGPAASGVARAGDGPPICRRKNSASAKAGPEHPFVAALQPWAWASGAAVAEQRKAGQQWWPWPLSKASGRTRPSARTRGNIAAGGSASPVLSHVPAAGQRKRRRAVLGSTWADSDAGSTSSSNQARLEGPGLGRQLPRQRRCSLACGDPVSSLLPVPCTPAAARVAARLMRLGCVTDSALERCRG